MKLSEIGPRMTMELFKVEQGVNEGDVLYHKFVQKDPVEAAKTKKKVYIIMNFGLEILNCQLFAVVVFHTFMSIVIS